MSPHVWRRTARTLPLIWVLSGCATVNEFLDSLPEAGDPLVETSRASSLSGAYELTEIQGQALPHRADLAGDTPCRGGGMAVRSEIAEGRLTISPSGRVELDSNAVVTCMTESGVARQDTLPQKLGGPLRTGRAGYSVQVGGGETLILAFNEAGDQVRAPQIGATWIRIRPVTLEQVGRPGAIAATAPDPTRNLPAPCRGHESLMNLPALAVDDTAGMDQRIAAAFPQWRLATEAEIGCVTLREQWDVSFWGGGFGSGKLWWAEFADVTGDGEEDLFAFVTHRTEPGRTKVVLVTSERDGLDVASGALLTTVIPAGTELSGCVWTDGAPTVERTVFSRATISVSNNMNWSYVLVWSDGQLRDLDEVSGLGACH